MHPLLRRHPVLRIFSSTKAFTDPWIGNATLNRFGLHPARIALADAATSLRRLLGGARGEATLRALRREGVSVAPDFLPREHFEAVRAEVRECVARAERWRSVQDVGDRGFGPKRPFDGGFDRWDGDTLNRFLFIAASMPGTRAAARRLAQLGGFALGVRPSPDKVVIYQTVHGGDASNRDIQKELHRDTFHATVKLWYFLEAVEPEHGPVVYVRGSHRMDAKRYRWEYDLALRECATQRVGSSFRVDEEQLRALDLPTPTPLPVRENTLIVADTRGFHRRGDGRPGARRLALYESVRPNPFVPLPF